MRTFSGRIMIRIPSRVHQALAREAFESGRSINQLCTEAILARKALKGYDPWQAVEKLWAKNRNVDEAEVKRAVRKAILEIGRGKEI